MEKKIALIAGLTALFAVGSVQAESCPSNVTLVARGINDTSGHVFEVWRAEQVFNPTTSKLEGINWAAAQACAIRKEQLWPGFPRLGSGNLEGHLATITSPDEDSFVEQMRAGAANPAYTGYTGVSGKILVDADQDGVGTADTAVRLAQQEVWVGGQKVGGNWGWINNEGPIETRATIVTGSYQNWLAGEPNNLGLAEEWLAVGLGGNFGWNDEGNLGNIGGFVVEYDYPLTVANGGCKPGLVAGTTQCGTVLGQTITFPQNVIFNVNTEISFGSTRFRDPRVTQVDGRWVCAEPLRGPLSLFEGKLVIPSYLCGSPFFVVVTTAAKNLTIDKGVVETTNFVEDMLPENDRSYDCRTPILGGPANEAAIWSAYTNASPQTVDTGVWQTLDSTQMWEGRSGPLVPYSLSEFNDGTAAELTSKCTPTLLRTKSKSYFVTGLHLDFGPGIAPQSPAEYAKLIELTKFKIALVRASVADAGSKRLISRSVANSLIGQLDGATNNLNEVPSNPVAAEKKIRDFLAKVNSSTYSPTSFNYNGDHLSRGLNIQYTLLHRVIAFRRAR